MYGIKELIVVSEIHSLMVSLRGVALKHQYESIISYGMA
nr:MAG TPA: hypothetical protein [Caudoviricetes sp.]